jgi:drug/metabolite transporter (DMT)-like permease
MMQGWFFLALLASALWGLSYTINGLVLNRLTVFQVLWLDSLFMFVCCSMFLVHTKQAFPVKSLLEDKNLAALCFVVMVIHVLASFSILSSIQAANASLAAAIEASYPIFTVFFGWLIFRKLDLSWVQYSGMAFILLGVVLMKFKS